MSETNTPSTEAVGQDEKLIFGASDRVELISTIVMSLAAIFTAWAAFQSAKWSGEQATNFSKAGATRTESTRFDTRAGQLTAIDVNVFTAFADAVNSDAGDGLIEIGPGTPFEVVEGTLSGFWYERVRTEFRPAFEAWVDAFFEDRDNAPPSPFAMDEYVVADAIEADRLQNVADDLAAAAGQANQNSDDYVLTVVAFALVLFFSGVSSKLASRGNRYLSVVVAFVIFVGATWTLFSLPRILPF
ncbi:MAG: hypothetical protein U9N56_03825 [Actinomycetota bacterium]|nr:hypothetical protein [Actinomycetota bacterium]